MVGSLGGDGGIKCPRCHQCWPMFNDTEFLTRLGLKRVASILQTTSSNAFLWMKITVFLVMFNSILLENPEFRCIMQSGEVAVFIKYALQWRHNERDGVSNYQPHDCSLNRLFKAQKKTSKLRVTGLCEGNSPATGEFPAQRASDAENVSIWWRHHGLRPLWEDVTNTTQSWVACCLCLDFSSDNILHKSSLNFLIKSEVRLIPEAPRSWLTNICHSRSERPLEYTKLDSTRTFEITIVWHCAADKYISCIYIYTCKILKTGVVTSSSLPVVNFKVPWIT